MVLEIISPQNVLNIPPSAQDAEGRGAGYLNGRSVLIFYKLSSFLRAEAIKIQEVLKHLYTHLLTLLVDIENSRSLSRLKQTLHLHRIKYAIQIIKHIMHSSNDNLELQRRHGYGIHRVGMTCYVDSLLQMIRTTPSVRKEINAACTRVCSNCNATTCCASCLDARSLAHSLNSIFHIIEGDEAKPGRPLKEDEARSFMRELIGTYAWSPLNRKWTTPERNSADFNDKVSEKVEEFLQVQGDPDELCMYILEKLQIQQFETIRPRTIQCLDRTTSRSLKKLEIFKKEEDIRNPQRFNNLLRFYFNSIRDTNQENIDSLQTLIDSYRLTEDKKEILGSVEDEKLKEKLEKKISSETIETTQKTILHTAPEFIPIVLERKWHDKKTFNPIKITTPVQVPAEITFAARKEKIKRANRRVSILENVQYVLKNAILHRGTIDSGHYTSLYCVQPQPTESNKERIWIEYDDNIVSEISEETAQQKLNTLGTFFMYEKAVQEI